MVKMLVFFTTIFISLTMGHSSVLVNLSDGKLDENNQTIMRKQRLQIDLPRLELIMSIKNFSQSVMLSNNNKKQRKDRIRKKKEKGGKIPRQKSKLQKSLDYIDKQTQRNNEKVNLVRNRTIEILKNGIRILNAGEKYTQNGNKSLLRVKETLLGKILSPGVSKQDILSSVSGVYEVPGGGNTYKTNVLQKKENFTEKLWSEANKTTVNSYLLQASNNEAHMKRQSKKGNKTSNGEVTEFEYEYDSIVDTKSERNRDFNRSNKTISSVDYERISMGRGLEAVLEQVERVLKNLTNCNNKSCLEKENEHILFDEDPCLKWLNCKGSLDHVFSKENINLPSCPCFYPSAIFYDDTIWDRQQKKYFRWRDASSESERLHIYKPGAAYCIRSLLTQGNSSISSQQCCYDRNLQLLTRGSGAGTINFISPDISKRLHYIVDVLPWRLCKGDFTRYNMARNTNNGNSCHENPDEENYQLQVKLSKIY